MVQEAVQCNGIIHVLLEKVVQQRELINMYISKKKKLVYAQAQNYVQKEKKLFE